MEFINELEIAVNSYMVEPIGVRGVGGVLKMRTSKRGTQRLKQGGLNLVYFKLLINISFGLRIFKLSYIISSFLLL